ncbi:NTP transferase domain-containing protein [Fulvimarina pelagi]|nr:NTP transferase domain-containing protein [Fulvimarina pelagi]
MRVIILAAGQGKRLLPHTETIPKAMVGIGGVPLVMRTIQHFALHPLVSQIRVVGGYRVEALRRGLDAYEPKAEVVFNEIFASSGPQASVLTGMRGDWSGGVMIVNGDTFLEPRLIASVLDRCAMRSHTMALFGSPVRKAFPDDVQIILKPEGENISSVGKNQAPIAGHRSSGIFHAATPESTDRVAEAMRASLQAGEPTWHGALNRLIAAGHAIRFCPVDEYDWEEIDCPEDLSRCNARVMAYS